MLLLILLATSLLQAQQAPMECVGAGVDAAATQTQPLRGPRGATAVIKVSSSDDASKDFHSCSADYQLVVTPSAGGATVVVDLDTTDDDYGRRLSPRLDGFTPDGKQIFGVLSEGGKPPTTLLFDYDVSSGQVQLIDLAEQSAHSVTVNCSTTFNVIGTTAAGAIVLELDPAKECGPNRRWLLNATSKKLQPLPQGAPVVDLYKFGVGAP